MQRLRRLRLCLNAENNTRNREHEGQSYNWADFLMHSEGTLPEHHATW